MNMINMLVQVSTMDTVRGRQRYKKNEDFKEMVNDSKNKQAATGELVHSEGEKRIYDFLMKKNILFDYDPKLAIKTAGRNGKPRYEWVRPDFHLKEHNTVIEYWGYFHDKEYQKKMDRKRKLYEKAKINLIELYPKDVRRLEIVLTVKLKQHSII